MGRRERTKGSRAEREFIKEILDELGPFFGPIDKNWNQREEQRYDLQLGPFAVEIKRQEKMELESWWDEAVDQAERTEGMDFPLMPVLAYRRNYMAWSIVMRLIDISYLMSDEATNLQTPNAPAGRPGWHDNIRYTVTMPIPAFAFFCREYLSNDVARGKVPP